MRVLGIDPGTAITGYAFVDDSNDEYHLISCGVIRTHSNTPAHERLQHIYQQVRALCEEYQPKRASIEKLFFSKNVRTAMKVGQARGVIMLALADVGLPIAEYSPQEIKQAVAGYGGADKQQIQQMVTMMLGLSEVINPDDAADAVAVAICHLNHHHMEELTRQ
ncbi:MAG: crossover junction endodeoxyribonuclease RuvC [Chloroflexota bacterium]